MPPSWTAIFQVTSVPGEVDIVLTDQGPAAAAIPAAATTVEVVKLTFTRVSPDCGQFAFEFNASPPATGPFTAAFLENQYIIFVEAGSIILLMAASTTPASGPVIADHAFIRGNVNNRSMGIVDLGDVVDLVNLLFAGFVPGFDCAAALDANDDGGQNIIDVVVMVQSVFGSTGVSVPPPNLTPGIVVPDGGTIPSVLGQNNGEFCF